MRSRLSLLLLLSWPDAASAQLLVSDSIEVLNATAGPSAYQPLDFAVVGDLAPSVRLGEEFAPGAVRVFHQRPDGRAGIDGGLNGLGREITSDFTLVGTQLEASGVQVLVGRNSILVTDSSAANVLASATMLNYGSSFEDLNGDGLLDDDEDTDGDDLLDAGEDANGNELLDFAEDANDDGTLDTVGPVLPVVTEYPPGAFVQDSADLLTLTDGTLVLAFVANASDFDVSEFLREHRLAPLGLAMDLGPPDFSMQVVAAVPGWNPYRVSGDPPPSEPLPLLWERFLNGRSEGDPSFPTVLPVDPPLEVAAVDLIAAPEVDVATESLPARLVNGDAAPPSPGNAGDRYDPQTGGFDHDGDQAVVFGQPVRFDELNAAWQHFSMETFAAHRLIASIPAAPAGADAMATRPAVSVIDSGVGNATNDFPDIPAARRLRITDMQAGTAQTRTGGRDLELADIPDLPPIGEHGTTTTVFAGGEGSRVLGIGKDVRVRPIRLFAYNEGINPLAGGSTISMLGMAIQHLAQTDNDVRVISVSFGPGNGCADANGDGTVTGGEVDNANAALDRNAVELQAGLQALRGRNTDAPTDNDMILVKSAGNDRCDAFYNWASPRVLDIPARGTRVAPAAAAPNGLFLAISASDLEDATFDEVERREAFAGFSNRGAQVSVAAAGGSHIRGLTSSVVTSLPRHTTSLDNPATTLAAALAADRSVLAVNGLPAGTPARGQLLIEPGVAGQEELMNYGATGAGLFTQVRRGLGANGNLAHANGVVVRVFRLNGTPVGNTTLNGAITPDNPPFRVQVANVANLAPTGIVFVENEPIDYLVVDAGTNELRRVIRGSPRWTGATDAVAHANGTDARGLLADDFPANGGNLRVLATAGFPAAGLLQVGSEIIRYNGTAANAFQNIERGYDGSEATLHLPLAPVANAISSACPSGAPPANCPFAAAGGTLAVASTAGFPGAGSALLRGELIAYTGTAGNTLTGITRGVNQTTGAAHRGGASVVGSKTQIEFERTQGSSFSAPLVAGLATELLFLDKKSDQVGILAGGNRNTNFTPFQVVEIIEATADDLGTGLALGPKLNDDNVPNAAPGDGPDSWFGFGRVSAWKAALAVANGGLASARSEDANANGALNAGPDANGNGNVLEDVNGNGFPGEVGEDLNDNGALNGLFADLPVIADADTVWYGFQIATNQKGATAWLDGRPLQDTAATLPDPDAADPGAGMPWPLTALLKAWRGVRSDQPILRGLRNPGDAVPDEDPTSGVVGIGTRLAGRGEYLLSFSIRRSELLNGANPRILSLRRPGQTAANAPYFNLRLDLAALRAGSVPGVVFDDFVFEVTAPDFGDAGSEATAHVTALAAQGPRHLNSANEWLGRPDASPGLSVSPEHDANTEIDPDGRPNRSATEHDLDRFDDGVVFFPLGYKPGQMGKVELTLCVLDRDGGRYSNDPDRSLYVNGWIDWSTGQSFSEQGGEHVVDGLRINPAGPWSEVVDQPGVTLKGVSASGRCGTFEAQFTVPAAIGNGDLWARFRVDYGENVGRNDPQPLFRSDPTLDFASGAARFGEVEDHLLGSDFGDAPEAAGLYPTRRTSQGARHLDAQRESIGGTPTSREPDACLAAAESSADQDAGGPNVGTTPGCNASDQDRADTALVFHGGNKLIVSFSARSTVAERGYDLMGVDQDGDGRRDEDPAADGFDEDGDGNDGEDASDLVAVPTLRPRFDPNDPACAAQLNLNVRSTPPWSGGKGRYHNTEVNDDRDAAANEDPVNGQDDDGDGRVDEDPAGRKPLLLSIFVDWNNDRDWADAGERVLENAAIAPETFGVDQGYTLGEPFADANRDGVRQPGEAFTDSAGKSSEFYTCRFDAPLPGAAVGFVRIRLAYAERGDGTVPGTVISSATLVQAGSAHSNEDARQLDREKGGALFGEVEDLRALTPPSIWSFFGIAQGGSVQFEVDGVTLSVPTLPGQTAAQVAANVATAIDGHPALSATGVTAWSSGNEVFSTGALTHPAILDPGLSVVCAPALGPGAISVLAALLLATGAALAQRSRPGRVSAPEDDA